MEANDVLCQGQSHTEEKDVEKKKVGKQLSCANARAIEGGRGGTGLAWLTHSRMESVLGATILAVEAGGVRGQALCGEERNERRGGTDSIRLIIFVCPSAAPH